MFSLDESQRPHARPALNFQYPVDHNERAALIADGRRDALRRIRARLECEDGSAIYFE